MTNVNRMRRYIARTTPDFVTRTFSDEEFQNHQHEIWMEDFKKKMWLKHPDAKSILVETPTNSLWAPSGTVTINLLVTFDDRKVVRDAGRSISAPAKGSK